MWQNNHFWAYTWKQKLFRTFRHSWCPALLSLLYWVSPVCVVNTTSNVLFSPSNEILWFFVSVAVFLMMENSQFSVKTSILNWKQTILSTKRQDKPGGVQFTLLYFCKCWNHLDFCEIHVPRPWKQQLPFIVRWNFFSSGFSFHLGF